MRGDGLMNGLCVLGRKYWQGPLTSRKDGVSQIVTRRSLNIDKGGGGGYDRSIFVTPPAYYLAA